MTGMSGAGKSTVLKVLEDSGFYCVDNLPLGLLEKFLELMGDATQARRKIAMAIDARSGLSFSKVEAALQVLSAKGIAYRIVFLDCEDQVLLKRFKETRRKHPLSGRPTLLEAIQAERIMLQPLFAHADLVIDTTDLKSRDLAGKVMNLMVQDQTDERFMLTLTSFGFKNGVPKDSDLIFDVRFLKNPFYVPELKDKRGIDQEVSDFVFASEDAGNFYTRLVDFLDFLLPLYQAEGRRELQVGLGCTGGHHRSVAFVEKLLLQYQKNPSFLARAFHRDLDR